MARARESARCWRYRLFDARQLLTVTVPSDDFGRAFVAMSYWLEQRGEGLSRGLAEPSPAALELVRRLSHPDRQTRARVLALEIARISASLAARRLV